MAEGGIIIITYEGIFTFSKIKTLQNYTVLDYYNMMRYFFERFPPVAGPAHLEVDSMAPGQTFPADDGAGVAGQVP